MVILGPMKIRGPTVPKQKIIWSTEFLCISDESTLGAADRDLVGYCLINAVTGQMGTGTNRSGKAT
jgi:hypothetical protein